MTIRIVAPYRPFPPETGHHRVLEAFDWMAAIRMMSATASQAHDGCPVHVLTDVDTTLPMPALHYVTRHRRLMLWYLEIAAVYLESDDFDRDTIMLDSDQLVFGDLRRWFVPRMDLGIVTRRTPKQRPGYPILNGVQFWPVRGKAKLARFYRETLTIAEGLSEDEQAWGADTIALERMLAPLTLGLVQRAGLVVRLLDEQHLIEALSYDQITQLQAGQRMRRPVRPVLDFRNLRKPYMQAVYDQAFGVLV